MVSSENLTTAERVGSSQIGLAVFAAGVVSVRVAVPDRGDVLAELGCSA